MTQRWKNRPEGSNWGDFGPDDQIGRLNLLTPEKVRQGVAEVKEGINFCLSLPLNYPGGNAVNPRRNPPRIFTPDRDGRPCFNHEQMSQGSDLTDVVNDDIVVLYSQYSSQWDSLGHVGSMFDADGDGEPEIVYYNGYRGDTHFEDPRTDTGIDGWDRYEGASAKALGIENFAVNCVQGRGVMIDLEAHFGTEGRRVGYDDIMHALEADDVVVEEADMVLLHTGFGRMLMEMGGTPDPARVRPNPYAELNGWDERLLQWITDSGLVALIADSWAVECDPRWLPNPDAPGPGTHRPWLPLHEHCLFKIGVPLAELWHLSELADWLREHGRNRFLLTAPPLRMPGAVGSPVSPVATV